MILTLKKSATEEDVEKVIEKINELGFTPHVSKGTKKTLIGVIGENAIVKRELFEAMDCVESITPISKPYKLASRDFKSENSVISVGDVKIGGNEVVVSAGPCSVEGRDILLRDAKAVKAAGAKILRGGAFKPRTSPYTFQGLGKEALEYMAEAREITGMPVVTEIMNTKHLALVVEYADMLQIGARNMQNFELLKEVGDYDIPVLLKRGFSNTINEWLMSAEYIMSRGNYNVILCERGIRTFETATRFTLDLSAIPVARQLTHLPIVVDPSHPAGKRYLVPPLAKAGIAAGADGLIIEVHPEPEKALSDGAQSMLPDDFSKLMDELRAIAKAIGRSL